MDRIWEILEGTRIDRDRGTRTIMDAPDTPTEDLAFLYILMAIQSNILSAEGVRFPTRMDRFEVHIEPNEYNLKNGAFSLEGVMEQVTHLRYKLMYGRSFLKSQVVFTDDGDLPTLILHFFRFEDVTGIQRISHESLLYPFTFHEYPKDIFSEQRTKAMEEQGINVEFIKYLPNTNLCPINFDDNGELLLSLSEYEKNRKYWVR